jgi:outer membrane protein assembly factor BamD
MNKFFLFIILFVTLVSCAKKEVFEESVVKEKSLDLQVLEAYEAGMKNLESGDVLYAAKKFNEAELLFPQSEWAPKSALMAAYSYYTTRLLC